MGEWSNFCGQIFKDAAKFVESFGYSEKSERCYSSPIVPNGFSPYMVEQTIRVTYNGKPKRRDPSRKVNRR